MKVLSIGSDPTLFQPGSSALLRQSEYARALGSLDIVSPAPRGAARVTNGYLNVHPATGRGRLSRLFRTYEEAKQIPCDVVTVQDPFEFGVAGFLVARLRGVPLHVQVHTDFLAPSFAAHSFLNRIRLLAAGFVLKRASRVRVVSRRVEVSLRNRYGLTVPMTVLPIYVDVARFAHTSVPEALTQRFAQFKKKLLVVGRLESEKNFSLAIRSLADIAREDACLIILGEGSARASLEAEAVQRGVSSRVFFEGRQNVAPYYTLADLVLVTSHYEGYGLVIIEALAAGKPVLSTDVGIARDAGAIVTEPVLFTAALRAWFENGPAAMKLRGYPYGSEAEYVRLYAQDIEDCVVK